MDFASLVGSGSLTVDVLLSGTTVRAGSGTIFSATLEMGSRALVSVTEAKPREKTAGRTAAARASVKLQLCRKGFVEVVVPVRAVARRENTRVAAIVCGW